ncbi:hydroxysqualene dehydroxylase [Streptomyces sp. 3N207]|uniref:hydroxysqualene dehydroxylase n=1 Tax=Streptomyces sp. 3N207 TaxID=3457417 RepID=UPI003FD57821
MPEPERRRVLRYGAGTAGALGLTGLGTAPALGHGRRRVRGKGRTVAVLGGGVGGLSAAHELAERGFEVTVYERKELGGKARSMPVPGTGSGGRRDLPGEHGHRGVFGFYHNLPDTLRRIPFEGNEHGVHDNLTQVPWISLARDDGRADLPVPVTPFGGRTLDVDALRRMVEGAVGQLFRLAPHEAAFFAQRLAVLLTSCEERRFGQWEKVKWLDFLQVEGKSEDYRRILGGGAQVIQALKPEDASTRTAGQGLEAILYSLLQRGVDGPSNRIFNGPTSEAWIQPWARHLRGLGVNFAMDHAVESLQLREGCIESARARTRSGQTVRIEADWFVAAVPVERARPLWSAEIRAADPRLAALDKLRTTWSQGIQFFLRRPVPVVQGHVAFIDSPWALVSISQSQFWKQDFRSTWGDGQARDSFSVVISDWDEPGSLHGRPAKRCSRKQVAEEVWHQLKESLEDTGDSYLPDNVLHSWHLDPAVTETRSGELSNDEEYALNDAGSWAHRPEAHTAIPNLFLAADYVRTYSTISRRWKRRTRPRAGRSTPCWSPLVPTLTRCGCSVATSHRSSRLPRNWTPIGTASGSAISSTSRAASERPAPGPSARPMPAARKGGAWDTPRSPDPGIRR